MLFSSDHPFFPYKLAFLRVSSFLSPIYNPSLLWSGFRPHTFNRNKTSNNFLISKASGHFPSLDSIGPFLKFSLLLASVRPLVIPYDKLLQFGIVVKRRSLETQRLAQDLKILLPSFFPFHGCIRKNHSSKKLWNNWLDYWRAKCILPSSISLSWN